jgi:hypothetical protein
MGLQANYTYAKDKGFSTLGYYSGQALGFPACRGTAITARHSMTMES